MAIMKFPENMTDSRPTVPLNSNSTKAIVKYPTMVFLVGFHKCGTRTTAGFFRFNGYKAIHNDNFNGHIHHTRPNLRQYMQENYYQDRPVLYSLAHKYMFYSDYGTFPRRKPGTTDRVPPWYQLFADQYGDAAQLLYILQIRDVNKWLHSRYTHYHSSIGFFVDRMKELKQKVFVNETWYILEDYDEETQDILMLQQWKLDWYDYMCELWTYFNHLHEELSEDLLIFDIERDDPQEIVDFGAKHGLSLNITHWIHRGNTKEKLRSRRIKRQFEKWDAIIKRAPELERTDINFATETQRIMNQCLRRMWVKKEKCDREQGHDIIVADEDPQ